MKSANSLLDTCMGILLNLPSDNYEFASLRGSFKGACVQQFNMIQKGFSATEKNPVPEYVFEAIILNYCTRLAHAFVRDKFRTPREGPKIKEKETIEMALARAMLSASKEAIYLFTSSMRRSGKTSVEDFMRDISDMSRMPNYNNDAYIPSNWGTAVAVAPILYGIYLSSTGTVLNTELHTSILKHYDLQDSLRKFGIEPVSNSNLHNDIFT